MKHYASQEREQQSIAERALEISGTIRTTTWLADACSTTLALANLEGYAQHIGENPISILDRFDLQDLPFLNRFTVRFR